MSSGSLIENANGKAAFLYLSDNGCALKASEVISKLDIPTVPCQCRDIFFIIDSIITKLMNNLLYENTQIIIFNYGEILGNYSICLTFNLLEAKRAHNTISIGIV